MKSRKIFSATNKDNIKNNSRDHNNNNLVDSSSKKSKHVNVETKNSEEVKYAKLKHLPLDVDEQVKVAKYENKFLYSDTDDVISGKDNFSSITPRPLLIPWLCFRLEIL